MRCAVLFLAFLLTPALCGAQAFRVQAGKTARLPVSGATAAFSLNSVYADAAAEDGIVLISGKQAGSTNIVVVTAVGTQTFEVVVTEPPPTYPPGFPAPGSQAESQAVSYEFRYSSIPSQQQNVLDANDHSGDRSFRLHLANANLLETAEAGGVSPVRFPSMFYEVKTPGREITFLDQNVVVTPLTIENGLVRGIHVRDGSWTVHAGYTALSAFQNLFLPTNRETIVGTTYEHRVNAQSRIGSSVYVFPARRSGVSGVPGGVVGSLFYEYKQPNGLALLAETGVSRGGGLAFRAERSSGKSRYRTNVRYKGASFAGLSTDINRGFLADGTWNRSFPNRVDLRASYYANRYSLPQFRQTNVGANATGHYAAGKHWGFSSGASFAHLSPEAPPGPTIDSKSVLLGVDFRTTFLSAGYQHSFTRNAGRDLGGGEDRIDFGAGRGSWRVTTYWNRQTEAPTSDVIVSETPGLREVMDRLGLAATSPEQIAQLIQQEAVLVQLGYLSAIHLNLTPVRIQAGGNLVWAGKGRLSPQVTAGYLHSDSQLVMGTTRSDVGTLSILCRLPARMDLFASWSLFTTSIPGMTSQRRSQFDISLRRRFLGAPDWLFPARGNVTGRVFEDDQQRGAWQQGAKPLASVTVVLDGTRRTRTDANGHFKFSSVPSGAHRVEVLFESDRPFYFTTPSPREVTANSQTDFGVAFATSLLVGYVLNDAHVGIPGIQVAVSGGGRTWDTTTDDEGKFVVPGVVPGEYGATLGLDSFPPGYLLEDVGPQQAKVAGDAPGRVEFTVRASRGIAGIVNFYEQAKQVPVEGAIVRLRELNLETKTGKDGAYIFRNLPAGDFTIVVVRDGQEFTRTEHLTPEPIFIRNADINLGAK